jgi:hypothetical protein
LRTKNTDQSDAMDNLDRNILTNILANFLDWESTNLESDFLNFMQKETKSFSIYFLKHILDAYGSLPITTRDIPSFDLHSFVDEQFRIFEKQQGSDTSYKS